MYIFLSTFYGGIGGNLLLPGTKWDSTNINYKISKCDSSDLRFWIIQKFLFFRKDLELNKGLCGIL